MCLRVFFDMRLLALSVLSMTSLFCVSFALGAQDLSDENVEREEPFRVEVEAVNVLVTVHDKETGEFITDLAVEDFEVVENGVLQRIANFTQQVNLPLTIALCVDTSASVKLKLKFEKDVAMDFLYEVMRPTDKMLLLEFDTGVTLLHDFTSNPNDLAREIRSMKAGGGTSLYDAIYLIAEQKMLEEMGRKTVVVLSDGADLTSHYSFEEALRMALRAEATIYAVSTARFGVDFDSEGDRALEQLAESTGGRVFFPYYSNQLGSAFRQINEELRSQYNLAYIPTNGKKDGTFRKIKVRVRRGDIRVRHRKGYYAPLERTASIR